jgi:hypothetical protein
LVRSLRACPPASRPAPLHNSEITEEEQQKIKASHPEIFERCRQTVSCCI